MSEIKVVFSKFKNNNITKSNIISNFKKIENVLKDIEQCKKLVVEIMTKLGKDDNITVYVNSSGYKIENNDLEEQPSNVHFTHDDLEEQPSNVHFTHDDLEEQPSNVHFTHNDLEEQTYLMDSDDSDEESLIENAKNKKYLNSLNVFELRSILKKNNLQLSKNGNYLKKDEMIKKVIFGPFF